MKTRDQLITASRTYFEQYPDEQAFLASTDGNFFFERDESTASYHAQSRNAYQNALRGEQPVEIFKITREEANPPEKSKKKAAPSDETNPQPQ